MKLISLIVSLLFGVVVLVFFLRPWEGRHLPSAGEGKAPETAIVAAPKPLPPPDEPPPQAPPPTAQAPEPELKRTLLAGEQAELERNASLEANHAITPEPPTKRYFKVKVRDSGTLEVDAPNAETLVIRLEGIDVREADASCTKEDGTVWPCGAKARAALTLFIRSRAVTCTLPPQGEASEFAARCSVLNQDLATWLVRRGWATPKDTIEAGLAEALQAAKSERVGLWQKE